jgi:hypothetical protein
MTTGPRTGSYVAAALWLGLSATAIAPTAIAPTAMAQAPETALAPRTYTCAANAHCNVYCLVDGEKQFQTGSPKEITVTPLARNNFLVELTEQNGPTQVAYLAGTKVVCMLEGLTKKSGN